jgi:hypothetical protein
MNTNDSLELLDHVLKYTYEQKDYLDVRNFFSKDSGFPEFEEYYLVMILNKLNRDGYVDFMHKVHDKRWAFVKDIQAGEGLSIRRNFDGHLFIKDGGYIGESKRKAAEKASNTANQERTETLAKDLRDWTQLLAERTNGLKNWTRAVALGAIGLVVWEILHFFLERS